MSNEFKASYQLTLDDFRALSAAFANLTPWRRSARVIRLILVGLLLVIAFYLYQQAEIPLAVYSLVLAGLMGVLHFFVRPWVMKRQFIQQRLGEHAMTLTADDEGFELASEIAQGQHKWEFIRRIDDLPEQIIMWPNNRIGYIVPKRAFADRQEAERFAAFAKEKTAGQEL